MDKNNSDDTRFTITGKTVGTRISALVKEGNRYRVVIANAEGKEVISIPATFAAIFTIIFPAWVLIAVVVALVANFSLTIKRVS